MRSFGLDCGQQVVSEQSAKRWQHLPRNWAAQGQVEIAFVEACELALLEPVESNWQFAAAALTDAVVAHSVDPYVVASVIASKRVGAVTAAESSDSGHGPGFS